MLLQIHEPGETPLPHQSDAVAVGIDLGTTHSVIAFSSQGKVEVLHDQCGGVLIPSVVHYGADEVVVGRNAMLQPQAIHSIKRQMGDAAQIIETAQGKKTPVEISAEILRHLRKQAEAALGKEVTQAVITVPAYFDDAARTATKDAAKLAGLEVLRLVNEPTAAALAYGLDNAAEGIYAVYDLGGGTFDISILKMQMGVFQVLATAGDVALGGDDIDQLISRQSSVVSHQKVSVLEARRLKEKLSDAEEVSLGDYTLTRSSFESVIEPIIQRTLIICDKALADASVTKAELTGIVLVGGSTRIPAIRKAVSDYFGKPALTNVNPDEVVAVGAALQAEGLTRGSDNLLLDVIPLSLGLETMGGMVEKIIHRNTPIPVAVSQEFTTYQDGQTAMRLHVLQGDREMVDQNRSLAQFTLSGIPPMPAGLARIKVDFVVDADGVLSVAAQESTTGITQKIEIRPSYGLAPEQIEKMLLESMEHAREDITLRLLAEAKFEAARLMEELKSAFADAGHLLTPAENERIDAQIALLQGALASDNRDAIDFHRSQLEHLTQPFAERRMDFAIAKALQGAHVDSVSEA
jgi:molecular chaperone HscA